MIQKSKLYGNKNQISVHLDRNGKKVGGIRSFYCKNFNEKASNSYRVNEMVNSCLSIFKDELKDRAIDCLWTRTNLSSAQDPIRMKDKINKNSLKSEDKLTLSFYNGEDFLCSGVIYLNDYPSDYRTLSGKIPDIYKSDEQLIDVLKNIDLFSKTKNNENIFDEIIEIFDYYLTDNIDVISIEDEYDVKDKFPTIEEHYKEIIQKKNKERKLEMSYF